MTSTSLRGSASLIIWGTISSSNPSMDEASLNAWWTNEHLPERLAIPGFQRTRRFYALDDQKNPHYLVWYEVSSLATLTSLEYMAALNNPTPGTKRFMPVLTSMNRSACRVLWSGVREEFGQSEGGVIGGTITHHVFQAPSSQESRERLKSWLVTSAWPKLTCHPSPLALHLLEHDDEATRSGSSTKSYEKVRFQQTRGESHGRWMVVLEFAEPCNAPWGANRNLTKDFVHEMEEFDVGNIETRTYSLLCAMSESRR